MEGDEGAPFLQMVGRLAGPFGKDQTSAPSATAGRRSFLTLPRCRDIDPKPQMAQSGAWTKVRGFASNMGGHDNRNDGQG